MDNQQIEAFMRQLVDAQEELHRAVASMMPFDRPDVQDVLQETNYALISHAADFHLEKRFLPFAIAFAKNQVLAYFKKKKRESDAMAFDSELVDKCAAAVLDRPTEADEPALSEKALEICRGKLSSRQKRLLAMRYDENTPVHEIAEQLHKEAASVSKALLRIRQRLGDCIRRLCRMDAEADGEDSKPLSSFESSLASLLDGENIPPHDDFLRALSSSEENFSSYLTQIRVDLLLIRAARPLRSVLPLPTEMTRKRLPFLRRILAAAAALVLLAGGAIAFRNHEKNGNHQRQDAAVAEQTYPNSGKFQQKIASGAEGIRLHPVVSDSTRWQSHVSTIHPPETLSAQAQPIAAISQEQNQKEEQMNVTQTARKLVTLAATSFAIAAPTVQAADTPTEWYYFKQTPPYLLTNTANYSINKDKLVATNSELNSAVRLDCGVGPYGLFNNPDEPLVMDGGTLNTWLLIFGQDSQPFYGRITGGTINVATALYAANWGTAKITMEGGTINAQNLFMRARISQGPSFLQINGGNVSFTENCKALGDCGTNIVAVTGTATLDFNRALYLGAWYNNRSDNQVSDASLYVTNGGVVRANNSSGDTIIGLTNAAGHLYIANGGIMTNRTHLTVGCQAGTSGSDITVKDGGKLIVGGMFYASRDMDQAHLPLNTTTLIDNGTMMVGGETEIGRFASLATLIVTNHGNFTSSGELYVAKGDKSEAKIVVSDGGTIMTPTNFITSYAASATKSTVIVDNGFVTNQNTVIARVGDSSLFIRNGGKWVTSGTGMGNSYNIFGLGQYNSALGEIGLSGGEIILGGPKDTSTQTIAFTVGQNSVDAGGFIHGWGAFTPYNVNLVHPPFSLGSVRSTIVADGEGSLRDLSLYKMMLSSTSFSLSPSNGWYATRQGRLRLPYSKVSEAMGGSVFIGSIPRSDIPDPVRANAVCVTNIGPYHVFFGDLYASDRTDIPAGLPTNKYLSVRSVWRIGSAQNTPAALWKEEKTLADSDTFTNPVSMFFRYNTEGYTNSVCGLAESQIQSGHIVRLWRYVGNSWKNIGKAVKGNSGILQVDNIQAFPLTEESPYCLGWFAITVSTFHGTVVMLM